jgi:hypothetical protein
MQGMEIAVGQRGVRGDNRQQSDSHENKTAGRLVVEEVAQSGLNAAL